MVAGLETPVVVAGLKTRVYLLLFAAACGGGSPSGPTATTPTIPAPAGQTFTLSGLISDASTSAPVQSARVQFMSGVNAGRLATTSADGRYALSGLRAGSGLVRIYGPQHAASERTYAIGGDATLDISLTPRPLVTTSPPFTYVGVIWDSRGDTVSGAAITAIRDSGANPLGIVTSGPDGTFSITTQSTANAIRVTRDGFVTVENPAPPALQATTVVNITIPRITRYVLQAVPNLTVGQSAILTTEVETDDGLRSVGRAYTSTTSSNESIVAIAGLGSVVARAPGTVTVSAIYSGVTATQSIQVIP
jgi:hypothetical protein